MKIIFIMLIRGYQKFISPFLPNACRFYPNCSEYAALVIQKHGVIKGLPLTVWRILRCNPYSKGGYDPVP